MSGCICLHSQHESNEVMLDKSYSTKSYISLSSACSLIFFNLFDYSLNDMGNFPQTENNTVLIYWRYANKVVKILIEKLIYR